MRIVFTGGGTGGHIKPFEPIIETLRSRHAENKDTLPKFLVPKKLKLYFAGVSDKKIVEFFKGFDVPVTHIPSGKIRRYFSILNFTDIFFKLPFGILMALWHMWRLMPDAVVSKGGYGSFPVVLAAVFYRIPILLHESDAIPGVANSIMMRFATVITVGFEQVQNEIKKWEHKIFVTGIPVNNRLTSIDRETARKAFEISNEESVLLVLGGSQGAKQINEVLLQILPELIVDVTVIHLTGEKHFKTVSTVSKELLASSARKGAYKPYPYLKEKMAHAIVAADAVVSRAGATTLAELARARKPVLLIPLAGAASDHQRRNASYLEGVGAALVLEPNNLGRNLFLKNIRKLLDYEKVKEKLRTNMEKVDNPNSAIEIADLTFRIASGFAPVKDK